MSNWMSPSVTAESQRDFKLNVSEKKGWSTPSSYYYFIDNEQNNIYKLPPYYSRLQDIKIAFFITDLSYSKNIIY